MAMDFNKPMDPENARIAFEALVVGLIPDEQSLRLIDGMSLQHLVTLIDAGIQYLHMYKLDQKVLQLMRDERAASQMPTGNAEVDLPMMLSMRCRLVVTLLLQDKQSTDVDEFIATDGNLVLIYLIGMTRDALMEGSSGQQPE